MVSEENNLSTLEIWHKRLGHLNYKDLKKFLTELKISFNKSKVICVCETCIEGKFTQIPFPKCSSRKTDILEIVHSDLFGPTRTESIGGARYVMTFVDDASRWSTVKFLKSKSEALTAFKS